MMEIAGFENYAVDENGNVFNTKKNKVLSQRQEKNGYMSVALFNKGEVKRKKVHRLVAEAFLPNPDNLPQVNHKDENKRNNNVNNLEWCTAQYNNHYGKNQPTIRAINARKKAVCQYTTNGDLVAVYESCCEAQHKTEIKQTNISRCCLQRKHFKTAGGFVWKYFENE